MTPLEAGPWPSAYPPEQLRAETEAMSDAWVEVLLAHLGPSPIGVYRKGSAQKPWHSRIDYVPMLSDVDIHVRLADDAAVEALDASRSRSRSPPRLVAPTAGGCRRPLHTPRPQLNVLNVLEQQPGYAPSPAATVATLFGAPHEAHPPDEDGARRFREQDRGALFAHAEFVGALPMRVVDRPGTLLERITSELAWRVSPAAPRVLSVLGVPFEEAWSLNRTQLVAALDERGLAELARAYAGFYLAGWDVFVEGYERGAGAEVVRAGVEAITLGARLAEVAAA